MKCPGGCSRIHHNSIKCANFQKGVRNDENEPISAVTLGHHPNCSWEGYINRENCSCKNESVSTVSGPILPVPGSNNLVLVDPNDPFEDIKNPLEKNTIEQ